MALELYMVGMVTRDLGKSLAFYRQLGLDIPEGSEVWPHVPIKMQSGITFFLNAPGRPDIGDSQRVIFEFYLRERALVDAKYQEMTAAGHPGTRAPAFDTTIQVYFALINDPDGHTVMLTAD